MEEVFKKWEEVRNHPNGNASLQRHKGFEIFNYLIREYFKQGEEKKTGLTKVHSHSLYKYLGMSESDFYNPNYETSERHFKDCASTTIEMLNECNVLFLLSEPTISNPYYTIAFTPILDKLIYFQYDITDDKYDK